MYLQMLGNIISGAFQMDLTVKHRFRAGYATFYRFSEFYECHDIPLGDKINNYLETVVQSMAYGTGSWVWSRGLYDRLM